MRRIIPSLTSAAFLISSGIVSAQVTVNFGYSGLPLYIYQDSSNIVTVASVFVPRGIKMTSVIARLQIEYNYVGDLKVYLDSPSGTRTILSDHSCGDLYGIDATFTDSAPVAWKDLCPAAAGGAVYKPAEPLSKFNADDSSFGTWKLSVENDTSNSRSGYVTEFSLTITGSQQTPVIRSETVGNAANPAASGKIAPGESLSIYGIGIGPTTPVSAPAGTLPTTLGGVQVLINGAAIPISYASPYRVNVQAPFNLTAGTQTTVQLSLGGGAVTSANVNVVDAVPALYTNQPGGGGSITAFNQDSAANGELSPAAKGSVITVYASGLGALNPPLTAGAPPPSAPLSYTASPVSAELDGIAAPVLFAGAAPGFPGLYQLNIQIPANVPSGTQELRVYINGIASQAAATVALQ